MKTAEVLAWLKRKGTPKTVAGMARYGIPSTGAVGVTVGELKKLGKRLGTDQALSLELWQTGGYEARLLASFVGDPRQVTLRQMDAWVADFDSWAVCDTVCFSLFDRSPLAWRKAPQWTKAKPEFTRRAGFALMACLALHEKATADEPFLAFLTLIEQGAVDERNFVKKAVNWALRAIGERNLTLNAAAVAVARRLAGSEAPSARWVGKDALRDMARPAVQKRLARGSR